MCEWEKVNGGKRLQVMETMVGMYGEAEAWACVSMKNGGVQVLVSVSEGQGAKECQY